MKPTHIDRTDLLTYLLATERAGRLKAEHAFADAAAKEIGKQVQAKYGLGDGDSFHPETGEIARKVEAAPAPVAAEPVAKE